MNAMRVLTYYSQPPFFKVETAEPSSYANVLDLAYDLRSPA